jgi:Family of unknown function (DUF5684)
MAVLAALKDVVVYTTSTEFNWGLFIALFLIGVVFYIFGGWLIYRIGKKLNYDKPWFAWIPFANMYMLVELSTREISWFWIILITSFIPCINIVGLVMMIIVVMDISEACGKESWWGILWIIPIVNIVIVYILGSGPAVPPGPPAAGYPGQYGPPPAGPQPPPGYTPPQQPPPGPPQ